MPSKGLQYLVLLSHTHSQKCNLVPGLQGSVSRDGDEDLVWECSAGHTFSWGPSSEDPRALPLPNIGQRNLCLENQKPAGMFGNRNCGEREEGYYWANGRAMGREEGAWGPLLRPVTNPPTRVVLCMTLVDKWIWVQILPPHLLALWLYISEPLFY